MSISRMHWSSLHSNSCRGWKREEVLLLVWSLCALKAGPKSKCPWSLQAAAGSCGWAGLSATSHWAWGKGDPAAWCRELGASGNDLQTLIQEIRSYSPSLLLSSTAYQPVGNFNLYTGLFRLKICLWVLSMRNRGKIASWFVLLFPFLIAHEIVEQGIGLAFDPKTL